MADVTEIQGRIQANAEELKMTLESALQNAGAALGGMADVLEEAKTRSQVQFERLTAEKEELQQTGRDVSIKTREVLTEQKKLDVLAKGISVGSVFKNVGQIQAYLEEFRKGGQSMTDVMGDTGKELLDFAENILSKKQFSELKDAFEKHADPMTPDELQKHEEAITKHLAGITVAGKDIAAMTARMEDFNASRANAELDKLNKQTHALLEKWFGLKEQEKSFFTLLGLHGEAGFKEVANALQSVVTPMNLLTLAMTKILGITKRLVTELDQLYSNFAKSGGLIEAERGGMFGGTIESAVHENRALGIGKETSFSAAAGLQQSYSQFSTLGEDARADLIATAAQLEVVGVSAQTTGKLMTAFTKQFGKSASESKNIILDMEEYGRSIGVTSSKMMEDWAAAMDTLSMFGEKSVKIFKELAKEAKKTGIEVSTLVAMEERFATFDESAELAGKFNAIAGRVVLDPMQLMMATGEEKQKLIQQAARSLAIDKNNPRAVKYAASSLGISPAEFQKLIGEEDNPEREATSLQEVLKMSISMGQKFKTILENIAVAAMPILTALHWLLDILAAGAVYLDTWVGKIVMLAAVGWLLVSKFSILSSVLKGGIGLVKGLVSSLLNLGKEAAGDAMVKQFKNMQKAGNAANQTATQGAAAGPMMIKAAAATAIYAGALLILAGAVWILAQAYNDAGGAGGFWQLIGALAALGVGMYVFVRLLSGITVEGYMVAALLVAIGAAFALFGVAALLFATAMDIIIGAAKDVGGGALLSLSGGLMALGAAMIVFTTEMAIASALAALGFLAFAKLLALLVVLGQTVPDVAPVLSQFASGLIELGDAFRSFMASMVMESGKGLWNSIKGFFGFGSSGTGFDYFIKTMKVLKQTIGSLPENSLSAVANFLRSVSELKFQRSAFDGLLEGIQELLWALDKLPDDKLVSLRANLVEMGEAAPSLGEFGRVISAVTELDESKVRAAQGVVAAAKEYYTVVGREQKSEQIISPKDREAIVKLVLDGREIAEAVIPFVGERLESKYFQDTLFT